MKSFTRTHFPLLLSQFHNDYTLVAAVSAAKPYAPLSLTRYSRKLVVGDLYRLPEVVALREQGGSRLVCLLASSQIRQSPLGSAHSQEGSSSTSGSPVVFEELEYHEPVCREHFTQRDFRLLQFCTRYNVLNQLFEVPLKPLKYFTLLYELKWYFPCWIVSLPCSILTQLVPLSLALNYTTEAECPHSFHNWLCLTN